MLIFRPPPPPSVRVCPKSFDPPPPPDVRFFNEKYPRTNFSFVDKYEKVNRRKSVIWTIKDHQVRKLLDRTVGFHNSNRGYDLY